MKKRILSIILLSIVQISCQNNQKGEKEKEVFLEKIDVKVFSNSILIPIMIKKKVRFFQLDTGAPTTISNNLFTELGLQVYDSLEGRDYYNNKKQVYETLIKDFIIGNTSFYNIKSSIANPIQNWFPCGQLIDGYLGSDFFSERIIQIDIRKKKLIIANSIDDIDVDGHNSVDLNVVGKQKSPFLTIYYPKVNRSELVVFDTGSNSYFLRLSKYVFNAMLDDKLIFSRNVIDTLHQTDNSAGLFGTQKDTLNYVIEFDSLTVGGINLYKSRATTFDSPRTSVLGAPFLRLGVVTMDLKNSKLYINPYQKDAENIIKPFHGITLAHRKANYQEADQIYVKAVQKGSAAEKNNIKEDYILKELNSIKVDSIFTCDVQQIEWELERSRDTVRYVFLYGKNNFKEFVMKN